MNGLDLFSGIGGIALALQEWIRPAAYCEIEPYCQSVLLQRMQEGNLPKAPIWDDIRTLRDALFDSGLIYQQIDIIYAGFPCQDISVAGRQKGLGGKRSGLFFEILRILDETKSPFIFLENVPNIRTKGAERICKELSERGYDSRWCNISASDVGARHKRERWFLLGYAKYNGLDATTKQGSDGQAICNDKERKEKASKFERANSSSMLANTERKELHERCQHQKRSSPRCCRIEQRYWTVEPEFRGSINDVSRELDEIEKTTLENNNRANRIKALGNSVVPLQVREAFKLLMGLNNNPHK